MEWSDEMKSAAIEDAQKVGDLTNELTTARAAIRGLAHKINQILTECAFHDEHEDGWNCVRSNCKEALTTHAAAIQDAKGE